MEPDDCQVLVLDDDPSVLASLERLLSTMGYRVRLHSTPDDFFRAGFPKFPACLLLDNHLGEGMTGVEVHAEIIRRGWKLPTVFLTAHWNVQSVVKAMRDGADGFVTKPVDTKELLDAVRTAFRNVRIRAVEELLDDEIRSRAASLTKRELEIVRLVVKGLLNKEIADQLGLAVVTVKLHRGRAMKKLGAGNPYELARFASLLGLCS